MGRFIPESSQAERVFEAVHSMFSSMISQPTLDRSGKLDDGAFVRDDLVVANELLATLERLYDLKVVVPGRYTSAGVSSQSMHAEYVQMKHWQKMLNAIYGPKEGNA